MISKFWDALFRYADELKKNGNMAELKTVHKVEDLLQKAWDDGEKYKSYVIDFEPRSELEEAVLSIPGITVWEDTDGTFFYELDRKHFDTPTDVFKYLVETRNKHKMELIGKEKDRIVGIACEVLQKRILDSSGPIYKKLQESMFEMSVENVIGLMDEVKERYYGNISEES